VATIESVKSQGVASYDVKVALDFFKSVGSTEKFEQGATIFAENEKAGRFTLKRDKMYLLLEGQVNMVANGNFIGMVGPGEIFGEMASLSQAPRSASAMARTASRVIALDDKQFQEGLRKKPEFALMMMSVIIARLRDSLSKSTSPATVVKAGVQSKDARVFDKKLLALLEKELGDDAKMRYEQGRVIMQEGQVGVLMYVVLSGTVQISIKGKPVEIVGQGAVFGEMALVEKGPRLASAVAQTTTELLAINRAAFLDLVKTNPEFGMSLLTAIGERARLTTASRK
jgi:CRP/FNR family transcriptional regulator, cyclic AMP receptor protein